MTREESEYAHHPQAQWEERRGAPNCFVTGKAGACWVSPNASAGWEAVVEKPSGEYDQTFATLDEGIAWALTQVGGPR